MLNLDAYKLKWIAIIGMVLNHMVITWWEIIPMGLAFPMYAAGGVTFPIMAYFVVEGYKHTSNLKRYMLRLFVVGLIAMPFHIVALAVPLGGGSPFLYPWLNILFSIILSLFVLVLYDKIRFRVLFWLIYVILIVPISLIFFEWYFVGVTMVLLFYIIRNETARRIVPPVFSGICWLILGLFPEMPYELLPEGVSPLIADADFMALTPMFAIGGFLAAILLKNYNGERGKSMKWLFYAFYPLHLFVLAAVGLMLGLINLSVFGF